MNKSSSPGSSVYADSLEQDFTTKVSLNNINSDENVKTILVPFYEKDVLIKIPKDVRRKRKDEPTRNNKVKSKRDTLEPSKSYLVNNNNRTKHTSYLEKFRKQFIQGHFEKKVDNQEIRSLSPEFGDTERESIGEDVNNPVTDFYNTESYNEIYYEKLIHQEHENFLHNYFEERLQSNEEKSTDAQDECNFRSISEVSQPRRQRRATFQPIQNVKLGGLGPDMELIKPRLERARSLQRYSEKVRMENRLRIYKKSVQDEIDKAVDKKTPTKHSTKESRDDQSMSYLVNRSSQEKPLRSIKNIYGVKLRSADIHKFKEGTNRKEEGPVKSKAFIETDSRGAERTKSAPKVIHVKKSNVKEESKSNRFDLKRRNTSTSRNKGINTETDSTNLPVQISFLFNVGEGVRPSTALRTLEEKHRMYQEQVKGYALDNNRL